MDHGYLLMADMDVWLFGSSNCWDILVCKVGQLYRQIRLQNKIKVQIKIQKKIQMQIMCSCSGRVVWCSWIRCREGGSDVREPTASPVTYIFVMYFLKKCKVFVQNLQNIWKIFIKYFQQPCTIGSVGSGGAQEGDPVSHRPFNNCSCSSFHQKMSRVFKVFVMHFNVFFTLMLSSFPLESCAPPRTCPS